MSLLLLFTGTAGGISGTDVHGLAYASPSGAGGSGGLTTGGAGRADTGGSGGLTIGGSGGLAAGGSGALT